MPNPERNKPPTEPLTLREWETLPVGEGGPSEHEADRLHALAERAARRLKLPEHAVPTRTRQGLKAGQVIGGLAIPGRSVETLPKIEGENGAVRKVLIHMLAVAHDLPVADDAPAALATQRRDLLERVVRLFAERLLAAVWPDGMPKSNFELLQQHFRSDSLYLYSGSIARSRRVIAALSAKS